MPPSLQRPSSCFGGRNAGSRFSFQANSRSTARAISLNALPVCLVLIRVPWISSGLSDALQCQDGQSPLPIFQAPLSLPNILFVVFDSVPR